MKKTLLIFFLFISAFSFGQDENKGIDTAFTRHKFSLELGGHYSIIVGPRFIKRYSPADSDNRYAGFTRVPAYSIQFGGLYDYFINRNWNIRTGLLYFNRRSIFESDSATLAIYNTNLSTVKYDISPNNIEFPVFVGYKYKRLSLLLGTKINILTYETTKTADIFGEKDKSIEGFRYGNPFRNFSDLFYPGIRLSYIINLGGHDLSFYTAMDMDRWWPEYYAQLGIEILLLNK